MLPKSPMGVAIGYVLGNRAALTRYTGAGFLAIDNNASERALRAVAIARKDYLFAGSDAGGRSAAVLYSVVGTCRQLGLDPFAYLTDACDRIPGVTAGRLDAFLLTGEWRVDPVSRVDRAAPQCSRFPVAVRSPPRYARRRG